MYSVLLGEALPNAIATFIRGRPDAVALGAFSPNGRAGTRVFWEEAAHVGLQWAAVGAEKLSSLELLGAEARERVAGAAEDGASRDVQIYLFQATDQTKPRDGWGAHAGGGDDEICTGIEW